MTNNFSYKEESVLKQITFLSGDSLLRGMLHLPLSVSKPPVVIGSHGLLSSGDSLKQIALAQACNKSGIAFFRFDHRGCGKSEGNPEHVASLDVRCHDLICAIKMIKEREDTGDKIGLFGSSMGGAVCLSVASLISKADKTVAAMVTVAAPIRSKAIIEAIQRSKHPVIPGKAEESLHFDISDKLSAIHNILIFHGDHDDVVPVAHAKEIYEKAQNPKKLIIHKNGDHRISNEVHQKEFIHESADWFKAGLLK